MEKPYPKENQEKEGQLQKEVDHSLKQHYHNICFNPEKKKSLMRLRGEPALRQIDCSIEVQPSVDNALTQKYVQYVYHKYNIEDPIEKQFRLSGQNPFTSTPPKQPKQSSTRSKLDRMRNSYKQDSSQIISSTHCPGNSSFQSTPSRQIGYRTKQKISFKRQIHTQSPPQNNPQQSFYCPQENSTLYTSLAEPKSKAVTQIPVIFRYCPMCQEVVLEHNIPHHEAKCPKIQQAYLMPLHELELVFREKVGKMEDELAHQLHQGGPGKKEKLMELEESIGEWLSHQDKISFEALQQSYHKVALSQYYLLLKLNWFRQLRRKILSRVTSL